MPKSTLQDLHKLQAMPLVQKVILTKARIREWVETFGEDHVYVSFSGGKDSTVLLHLVRSMYPNIKAVFCDTGLELPEIRNFVKTFDNVEWLRPKKSFVQVIEDDGYPLISKEVSEAVQGARKYLTALIERENALTDRQTDRQTDSYRIADLMGIPRRGKDKENPVYKALQMGTIPSKVLLDGRIGNTLERTNERTNERYSWEFEKPTATGRFGKPLRKTSVHECSSDKAVSHSNRNPKQIKHTTGKSSERGTDRASTEEGEYP